MTWQSITEYLTLLAGVIGPLTIILGFCIKYIWGPWEKKKAKEADEAREARMRQDREYHARMIEIAQQQNEPLIKALGEINKAVSDSQNDRKRLTDIAENNIKTLEVHETRLDDHGKRILVLETTSSMINGHGQIKYQEHYESRDKNGRNSNNH